MCNLFLQVLIFGKKIFITMSFKTNILLFKSFESESNLASTLSIKLIFCNLFSIESNLFSNLDTDACKHYNFVFSSRLTIV